MARFKIVNNCLELDGRFDLVDPLREAVEKWEYLTEAIKEYGTIIASGGPHTCALCHCYRDVAQDTCRGCPVFEHTLLTFCEGTPYERYEEAETVEEALQAAESELAFLKYLLRQREEAKEADYERVQSESWSGQPRV